MFRIGECENCEYANLIKDDKNMYLSYSVLGSENVFHSAMTDFSKEILDSYNVAESELLYENLGVVKNYNCRYAYWSSSCLD